MLISCFHVSFSSNKSTDWINFDFFLCVFVYVSFMYWTFLEFLLWFHNVSLVPYTVVIRFSKFITMYRNMKLHAIIRQKNQKNIHFFLINGFGIREWFFCVNYFVGLYDGPVYFRLKYKESFAKVNLESNNCMATLQ